MRRRSSSSSFTSNSSGGLWSFPFPSSALQAPHLRPAPDALLLHQQHLQAPPAVGPLQACGVGIGIGSFHQCLWLQGSARRVPVTCGATHASLSQAHTEKAYSTQNACCCLQCFQHFLPGRGP